MYHFGIHINTPETREAGGFSQSTAVNIQHPHTSTETKLKCHNPIYTPRELHCLSNSVIVSTNLSWYCLHKSVIHMTIECVIAYTEPTAYPYTDNTEHFLEKFNTFAAV